MAGPDCSCVYVQQGDRAGRRLSEEMPRARKPHTCGECRRQIVPGETYERTTGIWDGDLSTYKTCTDCISMREEFFCDGWFYGFIWENLVEHLSDVVKFGDGVASSCLVPLTPTARDRVCAEIERLWADGSPEPGKPE